MVNQPLKQADWDFKIFPQKQDLNKPKFHI